MENNGYQYCKRATLDCELFDCKTCSHREKNSFVTIEFDPFDIAEIVARNIYDDRVSNEEIDPTRPIKVMLKTPRGKLIAFTCRCREDIHTDITRTGYVNED